MWVHKDCARAIVTITLLIMAGCAASIPKLQVVSAGHTGCAPDDNAISNVVTQHGGLVWNATCKGTAYLCSAMDTGSTTASSAVVSCAPAVK
jgi:hypothetical protein